MCINFKKDDRLIKLVKENAAIYDVSHPHYRRTPVRMAIWDNIAKELGAPSRFLQTKWKNIRYNYLQELKCLETGTVNTNIRKRRFTEDLSFLKYTAYRRDGVTPTKQNFNGSDDSNSYMYPDNLTSVKNTYEVIELDQSDDETDDFMPDISAFLAPMNDTLQNSPQDPYSQPDKSQQAEKPANKIDKYHKPQLKTELPIRKYLPKNDDYTKSAKSPTNSPGSSRSSPLLTPMLTNAAINKIETQNILSNGNNKHLYSEVTIRPLPPASPLRRHLTCSPLDPTLTNSVKRKNHLPTTNSINNDPIELYCLSLVDCLKAMPRSERERVKFEFAKILKDAHYKDQT
ncbi:dorsal interacting protein 3 isoform 2-T2 [Cochliomyia hominivorax]